MRWDQFTISILLAWKSIFGGDSSEPSKNRKKGGLHFKACLNGAMFSKVQGNRKNNGEVYRYYVKPVK